MAGRPRKKPEYNPELQFNNFLQELRDAYEEADSLSVNDFMSCHQTAHTNCHQIA